MFDRYSKKSESDLEVGDFLFPSTAYSQGAHNHEVLRVLILLQVKP